jgi:molecular chaperone Hsp33
MVHQGLLTMADIHGQGAAAVIPPDAASDRVVPFSVQMLDVRGRTAQFGASIDAILKRHAYPEPVARLLAQALALAALLGSSLKFDGKFILQVQGDGPVSLLVADLRSNGALRGYARFDAALLAAEAHHAADPSSLLGQGVLVFTVDQGQHMQRYQGMVAMNGLTLQEGAVHYFRQSEQLPTEIRLAIAKLVRPRSDGSGSVEEWRAGGLIAQFMPKEPGRIRLRDLPAGDAPAHAALGLTDDGDEDEDDAWREARLLVQTIEDSELTDPTIDAETLLYRLFNQHDPRVSEPLVIRDKCSCTRERVASVLAGLGAPDDADEPRQDPLTVTCEFCSKVYSFTMDEIELATAEPS